MFSIVRYIQNLIFKFNNQLGYPFNNNETNILTLTKRKLHLKVTVLEE